MEDIIKKEQQPPKLSYKESGVDIEIGNTLVELIKPLTRATSRAGADGKIGGFGGIFDLKATQYRDPILVAATDGVGTKLKLAIETNNHKQVGIDLVAMCVNDLVVQGAEPLFFLDYYATSHLSLPTAKEVISGIARGCQIAGCALVGGETTEMPGMYSGSDYDLAGFAVGAVEREHLLTNASAQEGDIILGLASNGLHSNGFSLVRKIIEQLDIKYEDPCPFIEKRDLGAALMEPTRIYVEPCLSALREGGIRGLAHITGGGLLENPPRSFNDTLSARIDVLNWSLPPVYEWLMETRLIAPKELANTFNCGIGMILITDPNLTHKVAEKLSKFGETVYELGFLEKRTETMSAVTIENIESWVR